MNRLLCTIYIRNDHELGGHFWFKWSFLESDRARTVINGAEKWAKLDICTISATGMVCIIAAETTLGGFKKARKGNRTPFQILADIIENGEEKDLKLWGEYERVSKGRRALTWSVGLREWAQLGVELSDEEVAEQVPGGDIVAIFTNQDWKAVRSAGAAHLLDVVEQGGVCQAYKWLDFWKIPYQIHSSESLE